MYITFVNVERKAFIHSNPNPDHITHGLMSMFSVYTTLLRVYGNILATTWHCMHHNLEIVHAMNCQIQILSRCVQTSVRVF